LGAGGRVTTRGPGEQAKPRAQSWGSCWNGLSRGRKSVSRAGRASGPDAACGREIGRWRPRCPPPAGSEGRLALGFLSN
jgi:hypothetical protein